MMPSNGGGLPSRSRRPSYDSRPLRHEKPAGRPKAGRRRAPFILDRSSCRILQRQPACNAAALPSRCYFPKSRGSAPRQRASSSNCPYLPFDACRNSQHVSRRYSARCGATARAQSSPDLSHMRSSQRAATRRCGAIRSSFEGWRLTCRNCGSMLVEVGERGQPRAQEQGAMFVHLWRAALRGQNLFENAIVNNSWPWASPIHILR